MRLLSCSSADGVVLERKASICGKRQSDGGASLALPGHSCLVAAKATLAPIRPPLWLRSSRQPPLARQPRRHSRPRRSHWSASLTSTGCWSPASHAYSIISPPPPGHLLPYASSAH